MKNSWWWREIALMIFAAWVSCVAAEDEYEGAPVEKSPTLKEVLEGKKTVGRGGCFFSKDGNFEIFAAGAWMSTQALGRKPCMVFANGNSLVLNPAWLLIFDSIGPVEIIEWKDPASPGMPDEIKSVWRRTASAPEPEKEKPPAMTPGPSKPVEGIGI